MKSIIYWVALISVVAPTNKVQACAYYAQNEEYRMAFFLPFDKTLRHYQSIYFTTEYINDLFNEPGLENDRMKNCLEWQAHCGKHVKLNDIYELLYTMPPGSFPKSQYISFANEKKLKTNTFVRFILKKGNEAYAQYVNFVKLAEMSNSVREDPWNEDILEDANSADVYNYDEFEKYRTLKNPFLKKRWAFAYVRLYNYGAMQGEIIDSATNYLSSHTGTSVIDGWGYFYGTVYQRAELANIQYARCIPLTQEKLVPCMVRFNSNALKGSLRLTHNRAVRSNLYALYALNRYQKALPYLYAAQKENPDNPLLKILVCREINKCEDWLYTKRITGFYSASREILVADTVDSYANHVRDSALFNDKVYARRLQSFIQYTLQNEKGDKSFWYLAAAHLAMIRGNTYMAQQYMRTYENKPNANWETQYRVTRFLLMAILRGNFDSVCQQEFTRAYACVKQVQNKNAEKLANRLLMFSVFKLHTSGQLHKAALLCTRVKGMYFEFSDRPYHDSFSSSWVTYLTEYGGASTADSMVRYIHSGSATPFDNFVLDTFRHSATDMYGLREWTASLYMREQQYEKALPLLASIPRKYWKGQHYYSDYMNYLDQNPFYAESSNFHMRNENDTVRYTKYTFCVQAIRYQQQARKRGVQGDKAALGLAHAAFNMTTYGNSWIISRNSWCGGVAGEWKKMGNPFFGCTDAFTAYKNVYKRTCSAEIKATCCLMMALCKKLEIDYTSNPAACKRKASYYMDLFLAGYRATKVYYEKTSACGGPDELRYSRVVVYKGA